MASRVSLPLGSTLPGPGEHDPGPAAVRQGGRRYRSASPGCPPSPLRRRGRRRREGVLLLVQGRQFHGVLRLEKQIVVLRHDRRGGRVLNGTCRVTMRRGRHPKPSGVGSRADQRRSCRPMTIGTCLPRARLPIRSYRRPEDERARYSKWFGCVIRSSGRPFAADAAARREPTAGPAGLSPRGTGPLAGTEPPATVTGPLAVTESPAATSEPLTFPPAGPVGQSAL